MNKLEAQLIQQGYEYEEIAAGVYLVRNFLNDNEISDVLEVIDNASEDDWKTHYMGFTKNVHFKKYI